jgi:hypothetical protein
MYIPIGLIARAFVAARDEMQESDMRLAAAMHERSRFNDSARELWDACTGPSAGLVVLGANDWTAFEMDHVQVDGKLESPPAAAKNDQGYRAAPDVLGPGPHGFLAVCPGRHLVKATVGGRAISTAFTLYPAEAVILRLDRAAATWSRYDAGEMEGILGRFSRGELGLHDYNATVAAARVKAQVIRSAHEALTDCASHLKDTLAALRAGQEQRAVDATLRAGASLIGAPLLSFEPITSFIGFHAFDLLGKGRAKEAWLLIQSGLNVLPDDPTLLAVLGEIQLRNGGNEEGRANLTRALGREAALDERLRARVRELLGESVAGR